MPVAASPSSTRVLLSVCRVTGSSTWVTTMAGRSLSRTVTSTLRTTAPLKYGSELMTEWLVTTTRSPSARASLTAPTSTVCGVIQLSGVNTSTSARHVSSPQPAPIAPCSRSHSGAASVFLGPKSSPALELEPTDTNIFLPSLENATSRVQCPPPRSNPPPGRSTTFCTLPRALRSPFS